MGALIFGHVRSLLSSSAPDRYIRPVITFVIFASGLKYVGVGTTELGWILAATLLGALVAWLAIRQPWRATRAVAAADADAERSARAPHTEPSAASKLG